MYSELLAGYVPGMLHSGELFWRDHCEWLQQTGYQLRPRYQPDWTPSWIGTEKLWFRCEDAASPHHYKIVDARRISDGARMILKRYNKSVHPHEAEIAQFFSSGELRSKPQNHCVQIHDVLSVPGEDNEVVLVMPELRAFDDPEFDTIGEILEFFRQLFEVSFMVSFFTSILLYTQGVRFMHQHHVAHRCVCVLF
ncbi:hypothetical protein HGRIS_006693 [Hohenbuehelia grisea]|uniref:Uncharacterized protein n=1 Tax=Hohenbuehelia grisea TaxID=104357 RepID=A0ABR3JBA1_9AGAR